MDKWWLEPLEDNQRVEFDTMQGSEGPESSERPSGLRSVAEPTAPAIGPIPRAHPYPGRSSHPMGDFRFERHDTEVVDDSRRLHRHGQCRVAADAL